jgi:peptide deformylase
VAIHKIRISGDPVLHQPAVAVVEFDANLRELVSDMFETMRAAPGVGLAAPQIGVGVQLFVYEWSNEGVIQRGVAANPRLSLAPTPERMPHEDQDQEGCLSFPGYRFPLVRSELALLQAQDEFGNPYEIEVTGWLARIFQHEFDHLQGRLYLDRLIPEFAQEVTEITRSEGWGVPGNSWLPGVDELEA